MKPITRTILKVDLLTGNPPVYAPYGKRDYYTSAYVIRKEGGIPYKERFRNTLDLPLHEVADAGEEAQAMIEEQDMFRLFDMVCWNRRPMKSVPSLATFKQRIHPVETQALKKGSPLNLICGHRLYDAIIGFEGFVPKPAGSTDEHDGTFLTHPVYVRNSCHPGTMYICGDPESLGVVAIQNHWSKNPNDLRRGMGIFDTLMIEKVFVEPK